jgi:hypothetical protein
MLEFIANNPDLWEARQKRRHITGHMPSMIVVPLEAYTLPTSFIVAVHKPRGESYPLPEDKMAED